MGRRSRMLTLCTAACVAVGCQSPPAEPARPSSAAQPPTTAPAAPPSAAGPSADTGTSAGKADVASKLAESQIRSIDAMLAARAAKAAGVTLVEPTHGAAAETPAAKAQPPAAAPPADAAPAVPPAADAFRAVPSIGGMPAATSDTITPNTPVPAATANTPAPPNRLAAATSNDPLDKRLTQRAMEYPHDLAAQLDVQLLRFLNDETVPGSESLAGLDVEDRGVLSGLLDGLSNFRTALRTSPNLLMTRKIRPIVEMADRLRGQADLSIPVAVLCRSAPGFGNYTPIEPARLQAGTDYKPVLYYEIENFTLRLDEKNQWTTSMQQDLVLYDRAGRAKWQQPRRIIRDTCRSRRHDFFMAYPVSLPTNLDPGEYTLKVTLIDAAASRVAETGVKITVVAKADARP